MPQIQLTRSEADQIAAGVVAALAPAFDKLSAALAGLPNPVRDENRWGRDLHRMAAPGPLLAKPAVPAAPAVPRTLAELQEENHFLRSIAGQVEERIRRATPGSTSLPIAPLLERIAATQPTTPAALEEENSFLNKIVEHLLKQLGQAQGEPR